MNLGKLLMVGLGVYILSSLTKSGSVSPAVLSPTDSTSPTETLPAVQAAAELKEQAIAGITLSKEEAYAEYKALGDKITQLMHYTSLDELVANLRERLAGYTRSGWSAPESLQLQYYDALTSQQQYRSQLSEIGTRREALKQYLWG